MDSQREHSAVHKRAAGKDYCERCNWPLISVCYVNGQDVCGGCYGLIMGYHDRDRKGRDPPDDWIEACKAWLPVEFKERHHRDV